MWGTDGTHALGLPHGVAFLSLRLVYTCVQPGLACLDGLCKYPPLSLSVFLSDSGVGDKKRKATTKYCIHIVIFIDEGMRAMGWIM